MGADEIQGQGPEGTPPAFARLGAYVMKPETGRVLPVLVCGCLLG